MKATRGLWMVFRDLLAGIGALVIDHQFQLLTSSLRQLFSSWKTKLIITRTKRWPHLHQLSPHLCLWTVKLGASNGRLWWNGFGVEHGISCHRQWGISVVPFGDTNWELKTCPWRLSSDRDKKRRERAPPRVSNVEYFGSLFRKGTDYWLNAKDKACGLSFL